MDLRARIEKAFTDAGWGIVEKDKGAGLYMTAPDGRAVAELWLKGDLVKATLSAVLSRDDPEGAKLNGGRLAAMLALTAPPLLNQGWLTRALQSPLDNKGRAQAEATAEGWQARLTIAAKSSQAILRLTKRGPHAQD